MDSEADLARRLKRHIGDAYGSDIEVDRLMPQLERALSDYRSAMSDLAENRRPQSIEEELDDLRVSVKRFLRRWNKSSQARQRIEVLVNDRHGLLPSFGLLAEHVLKLVEAAEKNPGDARAPTKKSIRDKLIYDVCWALASCRKVVTLNEKAAGAQLIQAVLAEVGIDDLSIRDFLKRAGKIRNRRFLPLAWALTERSKLNSFKVK